MQFGVKTARVEPQNNFRHAACEYAPRPDLRIQERNMTAQLNRYGLLLS